MSNDDIDWAQYRRDMYEASKAKRASNRDASAKVLNHAGVVFTSHAGGAHLVVEDSYDFWPGTGLWIDRGSSERGRGVKRLIKRIQRERKA